jgi:hypothetical protein
MPILQDKISYPITAGTDIELVEQVLDNAHPGPRDTKNPGLAGKVHWSYAAEI